MVTSKSCTVHAKIILVQPVIARRWVVEFSVSALMWMLRILGSSVSALMLMLRIVGSSVVRVRLDVVVRLRVQLDVDVEVQ